MRAVLVALSVLMIACGRSPTAPSAAPQPTPPPAPASLSGTWEGRMTFRFQGRDNLSFDVSVPLLQQGPTVSGHWTVIAPEGNDVGGVITGTVDGLGMEARFTGTVTLDTPAQDRAERCRGQATFAGNAVAPLRWQSDGFRFDNCREPPTNVVWILNRP